MRSIYAFLIFLHLCYVVQVDCINSPATSLPVVSHLHQGNQQPTKHYTKSHLTYKVHDIRSCNYAPVWGVSCVTAILVNAVARLLPIALLPLSIPITSLQALFYGLFVALMLYVQGYKAFHLKFSPLVVARAAQLPSQSLLYQTLLAGPYCMGLIGATKKRLIISWSTSIGVTLLIVVVKYLPYPWRSIIDGGAVAGLAVGTLSVLWHYLRLLSGIVPNVDPCILLN